MRDANWPSAWPRTAPLLEPVMQNGRAAPLPSLAELRARHRSDMDSMPPELLELDATRVYSVRLSDSLAERQRNAVQCVRTREGLN